MSLSDSEEQPTRTHVGPHVRPASDGEIGTESQVAQWQRIHVLVQDLDLTPGSGRAPGEGNGNPLQCSGLENFMD